MKRIVAATYWVGWGTDVHSNITILGCSRVGEGTGKTAATDGDGRREPGKNKEI